MQNSIEAPLRRAIPLAVSAMVFLGAFLSFSMEPIVGRLVTPLFGGAVHVWIVALMMFQVLLLAGYLYAHFLAPRLGAWHLAVLLLPLLQWPLGLDVPDLSDTPTLDLIRVLVRQISLPFIVLSTTAVVAQTWWYSASVPGRNDHPFFLYGVSNLGAMVALFTYPFLVEPLMGITAQRWLWSIGYLVYAISTALVWTMLKPRRPVCPPGQQAVVPLAWRQVLRWLALSACTCALMLAVTNLMSMEIGSFPMVWVFPLALYLGSFISAFREQAPQTRQPLAAWLPEIALFALLGGRLLADRAWLLVPVLGAFYLLCLIANRELYRLRPHPSRLTAFYLAIAVGGCVGGILVSLVAPVVLNGLGEYPLGVLALALASWSGATQGWWKSASRASGYLRLAVLVMGGAVVAVATVRDAGERSHRNFYGISRILDRPAAGDTPAHRILLHGQTIHGIQYLDASRRKEPLAYYHEGGALYQAMALRRPSQPVAMVGLGAGDALAWFARGEDVTIFEIDPDMEGLARKWFSFFSDSGSIFRVTVGDARLSLQREAGGSAPRYGAILIDAFSGDGIPIHLLTLEAFDVYLSRLADDGLLVMHVSNRYYELRPVLEAAARARSLAAVATTRSGKTGDSLRIDPSVVVFSRQADRLAPLLKDDRWIALEPPEGQALSTVWTDDYFNVFVPLLRKAIP